MLFSSTHSHIEGLRLVDFTDFNAPFVLTFYGGEHIEVVFKNATSQTLVFRMILTHQSSCENLFNNASTSCVRVKSPQEPYVSSELRMDNI